MAVTGSPESSRLVSVAVPVPGLELLTYRVPDGLDHPDRGGRVLVPLGVRTVTGCVTGPAEVPPTPVTEAGSGRAVGRPAPAVRDIHDLLDPSPFVPGDVVDLALWVAEYYAAAPGVTLAAAMPPLAFVESERHVQITAAGLARVQAGGLSGTRGRVLRTLATERPMRVGALPALAVPAGAKRRGASSRIRQEISSLVGALSREGLVVFTQPLRGRASSFKTVKFAALTLQGHACAAALGSEQETDRETDEIGSAGTGAHDGSRPALTARQKETIAVLSAAPEGAAVPALVRRHISRDTLARLAARGLVTFRRVRVDRDPFRGHPAGLAGVALAPARAPGALTLTPEQERAAQHLADLAVQRRFHTVLLQGVTGSGKTEVYLRTATAVTRDGRGVIVLVPEIALTPAVAEAFRTAFGERVAIQHSGLSDGERHDQWHRIRRGEVSVVVGTRSAVFAPLDSIGLIVVDEEHDGSYKQEESPRYHARDVAVMRGKLAGALVVLGSATPSLESVQNALSGRYQRLTLDRRVGDRPLAAVRIVDMREEIAAQGSDVVISAPLRDALADRLDRHEQALILLNRRGFASSVLCRQCAGTLECPNCSVCLTVHRAAGRARCHYCNFSTAVPSACPDCAGPYLEHLGIGTERVEAEIAAQFPAARLARLDRDTVRRRGAIGALLGKFARRELDVLVGTQMIAKGHDFPYVTLVGVISADVGLGLADFRAAERTFQLLTQVAGRAGRGERPGAALVQTLYPDHYSIRHACRQDFQAFFAEEIEYRRAMRYPPVVALVNAVVRGRSLAAAMSDASEIVRRLRRGARGFRVLGPAPAPLSRLRGEHRAQLFLKGRHRNAMREALKASLSDADLRRRVIIDVDPLTVL